jgi:hypothetical protein
MSTNRFSLSEDTSKNLEEEAEGRRYSTGASGRKLFKNLERRLSTEVRRFSRSGLDGKPAVDTAVRFAKDESYHEEVVETLRGSITVAWKGNKAKTAMVTYHDLGLNHVSNFQVFLS